MSVCSPFIELLFLSTIVLCRVLHLVRGLVATGVGGRGGSGVFRGECDALRSDVGRLLTETSKGGEVVANLACVRGGLGQRGEERPDRGGC